MKLGLPLLDENQQKAASALVQKERQDAEEGLRNKLRGRPAAASGGSSRRPS